MTDLSPRLSWAGKLLLLCGALAFTHPGYAEPAAVRELHGRVQFAETGVPVAGATVVVQAFLPAKGPYELPPVTELVRAATSQDGSFALHIPEHKYKHLQIRVLGEKCRWNEDAMRLDKISDLDAPLEIFVTAWECKQGQ